VTAVLDVTLPVFALVACGWIAARRRMLSDEAVAGINAFVFWFALPAMLFRAVATQPVTGIVDLRFLAAYLLASGLLFAGAKLLWRLRGADAARSTGLAFTATHGNIGYLGLPLIALLGDDSRLPAMVMAVICDILVVIVGTIVLFELARDGDAAMPLGRRLRAALSGLVRTPLILGIAAGLLASATELRLPVALETFVRLLASAAGPCALFAIGASLGGRTVRADADVGLLVSAKLLVHPALVATTMWLLSVPPALAAIGVLAAALPSASNVYILSQRYGIDTRAIGAAIVVGTGAAAVTVSFVLWQILRAA
jgi:malonate transporter